MEISYQSYGHKIMTQATVILLGGGLEAYFDPKKRQAIRIDQPKKMKTWEKVKLPTYP